jgi:subtilisin family serine protease
MRPAWSSIFDDSHLPRYEVADLGPITKEWAWGGSTGSGVRVAVIDSGVEADHSAIGGVKHAVAIEPDPVAPGQVIITEGAHEDLFGHGTACAGIIRQVAPDVELYSIRVLGERLAGQGVALMAGLRWAIDNGIQVVNLSLGTSRRDFFGMLHELADRAFFKSMALVCAASNLPEPSFPAEYASVFSVAAHDRHDPLSFDYNPTPPVEFGAPGINVEVPWRGGSRLVVTGNSFAAPHITGLIARILQNHPLLLPFQLKSVLVALAENAKRR